MTDAEVLKEFDMIISVTEKTLNDQFMRLMEMDIIHPKLIIVQELNDSGGYTFKIYNSANEIPRAENGDPLYATIVVDIQPQVTISHNNKIITFILKFSAGEAWFWLGQYQRTKLLKYDTSGWQYAVAVNIDLTQLQKNSAWTKIIKVPDFIKDRLNELLADMYDVNYLFMDFQSSDLMNFIPGKTEAGLTKDNMDQLVLFMDFYMKQFSETGNPFILAYSIIQGDETKVPSDAAVPVSLKPTGTSYTMFTDAVNQDFSTLNFAMVTKGGHGSIMRSPDGFESNRISPKEGCDVKITYTAPCFSEALIIKPLYEKLCNEIFNKIQSYLTLGPNKTYNEAKEIIVTGYKFTIADWNIRSDIYRNIFEVNISNHEDEIHYDIKGTLFIYKGMTMDMGICEARASAEVWTEWSAKFIVMASKWYYRKPILIFRPSGKIDKCTPATDTNECAILWSRIQEGLDQFLAAFNFFDLNFLNTMLTEIFQNTPEAGDMYSVVSHMENSFNNAFILAAGGVVPIDRPVSDMSGNMSILLKCKPDGEVAATTQTENGVNF